MRVNHLVPGWTVCGYFHPMEICISPSSAQLKQECGGRVQIVWPEDTGLGPSFVGHSDVNASSSTNLLRPYISHFSWGQLLSFWFFRLEILESASPSFPLSDVLSIFQKTEGSTLKIYSVSEHIKTFTPTTQFKQLLVLIVTITVLFWCTDENSIFHIWFYTSAVGKNFPD